MPSIFSTEEERLAYLIDVNAFEGVRQLKAFIMSATNAAEAIQRLTLVTQQYARVAGISFAQARLNMAQLRNAYNQAGGPAGLVGGIGAVGFGNISPITTAVNQIPAASNRAKSALGSLATTFRHVIVGMLAFRVIQFFMDIVKGIGEATAAAKDFYKSLVNIELGVRALRRAGLDVTLSDFLKAIQELKSEFPIFSEQQLAEGFNNAILKTAQMGMSYEDLIKLMQISAGVASVTGKSMESVTDALVNAMLSSSGRMTITLAEATNLQINQQDLVRKARELGIKSIENGIKALSNEERKTVILSLAWEQYLKKQEDINASMDTTPAKIDAATAAWADLKKEMGLVFLEIQATLAPYMIKFFEEMAIRVGWLSKLIVYGLIGWMPSFIMGMAGVWEALRSGTNIVEGFTEGFNKIWTGIDELVKKATTPENDIEAVFGDLGVGAGEAFAEGLTEDQQDALDEFAKDIEQMALDIARKLEQDVINLTRKFDDIDTGYFRELEQITTDYERGVADANEAAMESIADANEEYRAEEVKAEEDYQKKLQQLRERFLFDLEDALRERDARQVLRLVRQYDLDKKNIIEEGNKQRIERRKNLAEELADIEKQRQRKLADLAQDAAYKRQKAIEERIQDRADAQLAFDQDQADEALRNKYKLKDLVDALTAQGLATQAGAEAIRTIMMNYFGPGGYTDQIYTYLISQITAAAQAAAMLSSLQHGPWTVPAGATKLPGFASGGAMVASRPTTALFGEGGEPELAVFIPLSKLRNPSARTSPVSGSSGGNIKLEVLLSPDLEARVIQQAASNVAATITRVQREK